MKLNKLFATVTACFCMFGSVSYSVERIPTVSLNTVAADVDATVDKWDGTVDTSWYDETLKEYHLETAEELAGLSDLVNRNQVTFKDVYIYLENDIDLADHLWKPIGSLAHGNKNSTFFEGAFWGKGHSIYNMKTSGSFCSGLFGYSKGTISSVNIVNCSVSSSYQEQMENYKVYDFAYAGGVCAYSEGKIDYCSVTGNVSIVINETNKYEIKAYAGGICGYCSDSIENCKNVAGIEIGKLNRNYSANVYVGGICGNSNDILRCENSGKVSVNISKNDYSYGYIGGIGGYSKYGVTECINQGDISVSAERENTYLYIGGIVGKTGAINNYYEDERLSISLLKCSNSGNIVVTGQYPRAYIGGIAGLAAGGSFTEVTHYILECSNFGNVSYDSTNLKSTYSKADYIGGIAGEAYIKNCYNWGNITGREAGALIPRSKEKRSDCYNAGQVNGGAAPNISSMLSNEDFAHSLGNKYVYVENDLPALSWEIEKNIVRPDSFRPIVDDYPDASAIRIATSDDLINFAKRVNNGETSLNAYLSADIELRNNVPFQISMYNGIFDGNGKTISGLKTCTDSETQGLFDTLYTSAIVKNLSIKGSFSSQSTCGGICAYNYGTIENCSFSGSMIASNGYAGGICGHNNGTINKSYFSGTIYMKGEHNSCIGGICGYSEKQNMSFIPSAKDSAISDCTNYGDIVLSEGSASEIGGICGKIDDTIIERCNNKHKLSLDKSSEYIAGICGINKGGVIKDSYNIANISAGKYIAGICGYSYSDSIIDSCYNIGMIEILGSDKYAGSSVGYYSNSTNCYYLKTSVTDKNDNAMTSEQFADGSVCILLNQGHSSQVWYQLKTDSYPVLDSSHYDPTFATTTTTTTTETTTTTTTVTTSVTDNSNVFSYVVIDDYIEITGIDKTMVSAVVPSQIEGLPVKSIKSTAFRGSTNLERIIIPNSVNEIGREAFSGCTALTYVELPNSIETIQQSTFKDCTKLKSITIPNSVTEIEGAAFFGCKSLESLTIPPSVTKINNSTFNGCSNLSVVLPETITSVGEYAFYCKTVAFMNPKCVLPNSVYTVPGDVVIYGYKNSTAEAYAKKYNREFLAYDTSTDTPGDINCDGTVSIADLVSLQNFLLGRTKTLGNWKNADLCKDNRIDVFDMVLMRRLLIEKMN